MKKRMRKVHPGEILKAELIEGRQLTVVEIAKLLDYSIIDIDNFLNGYAKISPALALKLAKVFGGNSDLFLRLQNIYDFNESKM